MRRGYVECKHCDGRGVIIDGEEERTCIYCDGDGEVECDTCGGTGYIQEECRNCDGKGTVEIS